MAAQASTTSASTNPLLHEMVFFELPYQHQWRNVLGAAQRLVPYGCHK
jgi:hypothetical protein